MARLPRTGVNSSVIIVEEKFIEQATALRRKGHIERNCPEKIQYSSYCFRQPRQHQPRDMDEGQFQYQRIQI